MDWYTIAVMAVSALFGFGGGYILATAKERPADERHAAYMTYVAVLSITLIALMALRKLETAI